MKKILLFSLALIQTTYNADAQEKFSRQGYFICLDLSCYNKQDPWKLTYNPFEKTLRIEKFGTEETTQEIITFALFAASKSPLEPSTVLALFTANAFRRHAATDAHMQTFLNVIDKLSEWNIPTAATMKSLIANHEADQTHLEAANKTCCPQVVAYLEKTIQNLRVSP